MSGGGALYECPSQIDRTHKPIQSSAVAERRKGGTYSFSISWSSIKYCISKTWPGEIHHTERQFLCPMHFYLSEGNAGWSR